MTSLELVPFSGTLGSRTQNWSSLSLEERKRRAVRACLSFNCKMSWN